MNFEKTYKRIVNDIKTMCGTMYSNGYSFCNMVLDPSMAHEDSTVYPTTVELIDFVKRLFSGELNVKPLPQKALDEMKRKGLTAKPGPMDMTLIFIVPSNTHIVMSVLDPNSILNMEEYILKDLELESIEGRYYIIPHAEPFKACDDVLRRSFEYLKFKGLYKEEVEDD